MQRIKIDLTLDEPLVLPPVTREVDHPYSDRPQDGISILAYGYEEVFAEKVRALAQRLRPRDLYDVIHLHRRMDLGPNRSKIRETLERKCKLRGIAIPTIASLETHENRAFLESEWANQLKHQITVLPNFQSFLSELPQVLDWIEGEEAEELEVIGISDQGEEEAQVVTEKVSTLVLLGPTASYMDRIRFAAANRLSVRLGYNGEYRFIEPYSLARSSEGNLLLRAVRSDSGETRSYRWDKIESVSVTENTFTPKYIVEITSAGYLPIHQLERKPSASRSGYGRRSSGPTYVYRCGLCGKKFKRNTQSSKLNEHKDKNGNRCYGHYALFEGME